MGRHKAGNLSTFMQDFFCPFLNATTNIWFLFYELTHWTVIFISFMLIIFNFLLSNLEESFVIYRCTDVI